MTPREIREAYRAFNRASAEAFRLQRDIREADRLIANLELLMDGLRRQELAK